MNVRLSVKLSSLLRCFFISALSFNFKIFQLKLETMFIKRVSRFRQTRFQLVRFFVLFFYVTRPLLIIRTARPFCFGKVFCMFLINLWCRTASFSRKFFSGNNLCFSISRFIDFLCYFYFDTRNINILCDKLNLL